MNRLHGCRALGPAVILWAGLAAGARAQMALSTAAPAGPVSWLHLTPDCRPASTDLAADNGEQPRIVACGATGFFVFGKPGLHYRGSCPSVDGATETPAAIPVEKTPSYPQALPCSQGSCSSHTAGRRWVAVVDWPTEHGWSVAATIREASDQRVETELYDLTGSGTLSQWAPSVSDLHVLVQLCAVADAVQARPADRPLAVNMSFGRRVTEADCAQLAAPTLGCAVGRVLSDLAGAGVLPVAAAGNDHEMLFPASSPDVVSAGALDLSWFEKHQATKPSAQTPPTAAALMLGYGLYLSADGKAPYWPAPPGNSYAAALFTGWYGGWLSGILAGGGKPPDPLSLRGAHWAPVLDAPTQGLALALNGGSLPGSGLTGPRLLLDRAMGIGAPPHDPQTGGITLAFQGPAPPLPELSLLHADDGNGPLPGVDPCVPCGAGPPARTEEEGSGETVTVDLSSSGALPSQMDLIAVFLRVGNAYYSFEGSRDPSLLAAVAAGTLKGLTLSGVGDILKSGEQPSLSLVINVGGYAYWHEIPIHLPAGAP